MHGLSSNLVNSKNSSITRQDLKSALQRDGHKSKALPTSKIVSANKYNLTKNEGTIASKSTTLLGTEVGMGAIDITDGLAYQKLAPLYAKSIAPPLGESLEEEKTRFLATLEYAKDLDGDAKTKAVLTGIQGRFSHADFSYAMDVGPEGKNDFWSPPTQIITDNGKNIDCDDFTTMAKFWGDTAKENGLIPEGGHFEFVCGRLPGGGGHAICVYYDPNGETYALDGTCFSQGTGAWDLGATDKLVTFSDYMKYVDFVPFSKPTYTFENYNAFELSMDNPGKAFVELPIDVEVINGNGESEIIKAGTRCAFGGEDSASGSRLFSRSEYSYYITLADGQKMDVNLNQIDELTPALKEIDGSAVTDINGEYYSMKPYASVYDLAPVNNEGNTIAASISDDDLAELRNADGFNFPDHFREMFAPYTPEHIAELFDNPELLAAEAAGAAGEALLPAIMAMRKWNAVKSRHAAANAVDNVLKKWLENPNWEDNKCKEFTEKDMRDALKVACLLELIDKGEDNRLKNILEILSENGELYNKAPYEQTLDFLKKLDGIFGKNEFSSKKLNSVADVRALNRDLHALGIHAKYTTSKIFGRGDITSISPKVQKVGFLLKNLRDAEKNPSRGDFHELLQNQRKELESFASLRDYAYWKTKHHRNRSFVFSLAASIGVIPDLGVSDLLKSTAYNKQAMYQNAKSEITSDNIDKTLILIRKNKASLTISQYHSIGKNLIALRNKKIARSKIKLARDKVNTLTHIGSAIATVPAYLGGPVGVTARRATKGGVKIINACVAAKRLSLDTKHREKNDSDSSVISVYKDIKELHESSPELANKIIKQLFDLNKDQFEILCKTTLVERQKVKLSTSARN